MLIFGSHLLVIELPYDFMQVREACTAALKENIKMANGADNMSHAVDTKSKLLVTSRHFESALTRVSPSVSNTVSILLKSQLHNFLGSIRLCCSSVVFCVGNSL